MPKVTRQQRWVSHAAEEFLSKSWLSNWQWANAKGESFAPYDFIKQSDEILRFADAKSSLHPEHLQVSARWVARKVETGFGEMSVIAVTYDPRIKGMGAFRAIGWASVDRLAGYGLRTGNSRWREPFIFLPKRQLQPMRTLPT